jgi:hypothetical protein
MNILGPIRIQTFALQLIPIVILSFLISCRLVIPQSEPTPARGFIELEKTRFASTEQVFFWVGVTAPSKYSIPQDLWKTCRLLIKRPDGTEKVQIVSWPIDGMLDHPWRGGMGLGSEPLQLGRYVVWFEFAGQQSAPASFTVEDLPILKDITGEFLFPSPFVLGARDQVLALNIRNRSTQTIRFPHRGEMNESVSVKLSSNSLRSEFFIPDEVLHSAAGITRTSIENTFTWDLASKVSTVTLAPGGTYRLRLPVSARLNAAAESGSVPAGEYEVQLSTMLQVLIGETDGPWRDLAPIRLHTASTGRATLK